MRCLFASDLHGQVPRWQKLFAEIEREPPAAVFLGGDLLPSGLRRMTLGPGTPDFLHGFVAPGLERLRTALGDAYPPVFTILGNDDARFEEASVLEIASRGLWEYAHDRRCALGDHSVYGYSYIPPSPFRLKDWERYDVSRYVDPGCVSPEEGARSVPVSPNEARFRTIQADLEDLAGDDDLSRAVFLFHCPPYQTKLDRAALDGQMIDHVPLDVNIGSIAIRRFLEARQPPVSLHGHVHESARLTGAWMDRLGDCVALGGAHDGPELALVRFDPADPAGAVRELL